MDNCFNVKVASQKSKIKEKKEEKKKKKRGKVPFLPSLTGSISSKLVFNMA